MRLLLKLLVALVPVLLVVGLLRLCEGDSGRRWLARLQDVDPDLVIATDQPDLLAIAPTVETGAAAGLLALHFREELAGQYGDLLGEGTDRRMVLVVFSKAQYISEFGGKDVRVDRRSINDIIGLTQANRNAIYLPPDARPDVLRHEVVHLLMGQSTQGQVNYSPWLSEGLAQYFEFFNPPRPVAIGGQEKAFLRAKLGSGELGVRRLVELQDKDEFLQEGRADNYLRSLVLAAFLMETRPREQIREYIEGERRPQGNRPALFARIFGDPDALETEIAKYLR